MQDTKPEYTVKTELLPVAEVSPNKRNSRTHSETQVAQIVDSIREFGWTSPVLVDENNVLIAGHGRLQAARTMSLTHIPAIRIEHLSESQKRILMIADNKIPENAGWDMDALTLELSALKDDGCDLSLTGWSAEELPGLEGMCVPGSLEDIDGAGAEDDQRDPPQRQEDEETSGWEKLYLKLPPETMQVFHDLMHRSRGKPHEQFEKLLAAVDVMALEELARTEARAKV